MRQIKFYQAFLIFVSAIAGTGIFFTPIILTELTNLVIYHIYLWIFIGILFVLFSIVFANMIYILPEKGGIYDYVKHLNKHIGFLAGWLEYFSIVIVSAFLLNLSLSTLSQFFNINITITSILLILLFIILILLGARISLNVLTAFGLFTLITFMLVFFYSIFSFMHIDFSKLHLNKEEHWILYLPIMIAAIFETYAGMEILGYFANRDNAKILSKATLFGSITLYIFYILLTFFMILCSYYFGKFYDLLFIGKFLLLLVSLQMFGTIFAWMVSAPNLLYRIAEDENLPSIFKRTNKYKVPSLSVLLTGFLILFFFLTGAFESLIKYYFISIITIYSLVSLTYLKLSDIKESFLPKRISKLCAILSVILSILLLTLYSKEAIYLTPLLIIGLSFYIAKEIQRNKTLIRIFAEIFSPIIDKFWALFAKEDIKIIEKLVGDLDNKIVLDFGSSTGPISIYLAERYNCIIYSSEISRHALEILKKKAQKKKIINIVPILDEPDRIFEKFEEFFDVVIAYHTLSLIKEKDLFFKDLYRALKPRGVFVAIVYDNIFKIFEAPNWIRDIDIILSRYGFDTVVVKEKCALWDKIIIFARKIR